LKSSFAPSTLRAFVPSSPALADSAHLLYSAAQLPKSAKPPELFLSPSKLSSRPTSWPDPARPTRTHRPSRRPVRSPSGPNRSLRWPPPGLRRSPAPARFGFRAEHDKPHTYIAAPPRASHVRPNPSLHATFLGCASRRPCAAAGRCTTDDDSSRSPPPSASRRHQRLRDVLPHLLSLFPRPGKHRSTTFALGPSPPAKPTAGSHLPSALVHGELYPEIPSIPSSSCAAR
jgi:hypothetical protein